VVDEAHDGLPNLELVRRMRLATLGGVCGVERGAIDLGKVGLPEIERIHLVAGMRRAAALDEARRDGLRCRATARGDA
jgi:hypothetical protein